MSRPTRKIAGAEVSAMGVGAMSFAEFYGPTTEENSWAVLDAAMELGVTHIDTSNVYGMGRSEEAIGAYLRRNGAAREVFHIATKAGISKDAAGNRCFDNSPEHLEAELDRSLSRMGIEAVDLFYVHRREEARPIEEVTATLVALRDMGVDVPSQVAVAGFDNIPLARLISPGLTTMAVDIADMGARGINRLVALIDGEAVPQMELRQPGLIIRTSSQLSAA